MGGNNTSTSGGFYDINYKGRTKCKAIIKEINN
jgi:hypothetical protein